MSNDLKKDRLIDSFLSNLRLEKGLSENTIKAYSNDCYAFSKWLFSKKKYQVLSATEKDIENYLKHFHNSLLSHTSINRKLSSLKHFYCRSSFNSYCLFILNGIVVSFACSNTNCLLYI